MDRRQFLISTGAVSLAGAATEFAAAAPTLAADVDYDPTERSFAELAAAMRSGRTTSAGLTAAYLARIALFDANGPRHRAVLSLDPGALAAARRLDAERAAGHVRGPLHGLPILIKDNVETRGPLPTTAGSLALAHSRRPADAPLVARLRAAGAVVLGKTNLSEWANFRSTHSSSGWSGLGGQTGNAYDPSRNPSGSSAGSAVAAAASFCAGAIGTETNGSILSPSSLNGLVGLKPTVGLVSGRGIVPISHRQDTAGPMCRTVADAAALAAAMAGRPLGYGAYGTDLEGFRLRGVHLGAMPVPKSAHPKTADLYRTARAALRGEGAVIADLTPPKALEETDEAEFEALLYEFKEAIAAYLATLDPHQVPSRNLADLIAFNRAHANEELIVFDQDIFEMAEERGPLSDPKYRNALATLERGADREGLAALFATGRADVLIAPSNGPADRIDEVWGDREGGGWPSIASAAAIAGYPSLTVPAGRVCGLPVGLTLVGRRNQDGLLLQVAHAFERATRARVAPQLVG